MQKNHKVSYFINFLGILAVFGIFALLFEGKAFGTSTNILRESVPRPAIPSLW